MRFYLDTCCYNRPYDDQTQERIHLEEEAVLAIINRREQNDDEIIGSPVLDFEIEQIENGEKQEKVKNFYTQIIDREINYSINGLVREPGWLSNKSCKMLRILLFFKRKLFRN
jgi:hypothetical protein